MRKSVDKLEQELLQKREAVRQAEVALRVAKAREDTEARKKDARANERRRHVLGAWELAKMAQDEAYQIRKLNELDHVLKSQTDRKLFNLPDR